MVGRPAEHPRPRGGVADPDPQWLQGARLRSFGCDSRGLLREAACAASDRASRYLTAYCPRGGCGGPGPGLQSGPRRAEPGGGVVVLLWRHGGEPPEQLRQLAVAPPEWLFAQGFESLLSRPAGSSPGCRGSPAQVQGRPADGRRRRRSTPPKRRQWRGWGRGRRRRGRRRGGRRRGLRAKEAPEGGQPLRRGDARGLCAARPRPILRLRHGPPAAAVFGGRIAAARRWWTTGPRWRRRGGQQPRPGVRGRTVRQGGRREAPEPARAVHAAHGRARRRRGRSTSGTCSSSGGARRGRPGSRSSPGSWRRTAAASPSSPSWTRRAPGGPQRLPGMVLVAPDGAESATGAALETLEKALGEVRSGRSGTTDPPHRLLHFLTRLAHLCLVTACYTPGTPRAVEPALTCRAGAAPRAAARHVQGPTCGPLGELLQPHQDRPSPQHLRHHPRNSRDAFGACVPWASGRPRRRGTATAGACGHGPLDREDGRPLPGGRGPARAVVTLLPAVAGALGGGARLSGGRQRVDEVLREQLPRDAGPRPARSARGARRRTRRRPRPGRRCSPRRTAPRPAGRSRHGGHPRRRVGRKPGQVAEQPRLAGAPRPRQEDHAGRPRRQPIMCVQIIFFWSYV